MLLSPLLQATNRSARILTLSTLLILSLSACRPATPAPWRWQRAEGGLPHQAIVLSIVADPDNPARLWAGYYAPGGLVASVDGGQTWKPAATGLDGNPVFELLALPPATDNSPPGLWAATRDGLRQSLDGGASWQPPVAGLPPVTAFALASDANGRLYVGLDGAGIYAEAQNGAGWEPLPAASLAEKDRQAALLASAAVLSLAVSPDGQHIYAGTAARGIFASQDGGRSWVNAYSPEYIPNVALDPAEPALAVAGLHDRLLRSRDGGRSWYPLPVLWARDEVASLLWLADGRLGVGTGRGRLYQSPDGGDTWLEGSIGPASTGSVLALTTAGGSLTNSPPRFLAGAWTGVYASDDSSQTWSHLGPALGTPNAHTLLSVDNQLLLGTRAGLFRWQPDTGRWGQIAGEFLPGGVMSLAVAPSDNLVLYAGTTDDGVYRSDDGGASWQHTASLSVGIPALAVDPADPDHVYMLAVWERVYESLNGGRNWRARWDGLGVTSEAASLAVDPLEPVVYAGVDAGLYRSRNGADWQPVAPSLAGQSVVALMAQPVPEASGHGSVLYIGATRGAYRSLDHGDTVQTGASELGWGRGLEDVSVTAFLADPAEPQQLYAGTAYAGIYQSLDWGQTWQSIGPAELAGDVVESLAWGPAGELFAAAASGVWRGMR